MEYDFTIETDEDIVLEMLSSQESEDIRQFQERVEELERKVKADFKNEYVPFYEKPIPKGFAVKASEVLKYCIKRLLWILRFLKSRGKHWDYFDYIPKYKERFRRYYEPFGYSSRFDGAWPD